MCVCVCAVCVCVCVLCVCVCVCVCCVCVRHGGPYPRVSLTEDVLFLQRDRGELMYATEWAVVPRPLLWYTLTWHETASGEGVRGGEQMPSTIWLMSLHAVVTATSCISLSCRMMGRSRVCVCVCVLGPSWHTVISCLC